MTKKQKAMLSRIIAAFIIYITLAVTDHMEILPEGLGLWGKMALYLVPYVLIGWDIVYKAFRNIRNGQVFDENFLMTVATFGAFGVGEYSEAVAVMLFYQVGELFQSYAVNRSRQSITELMDICPEYANIEEDGQLKQVDPDDVQVGDIIVVKAGERIPLDGKVVFGNSMVDTSALTGESVPRKVAEGDDIISGCVNGSGLLLILLYLITNILNYKYINYKSKISKSSSCPSGFAGTCSASLLADGCSCVTGGFCLDAGAWAGVRSGV